MSALNAAEITQSFNYIRNKCLIALEQVFGVSNDACWFLLPSA